MSAIRSRTADRVVAIAHAEHGGADVRIDLYPECTPRHLARLRDEARMLSGLSGRKVSVGEGPLRIAGWFATVREHRGGRDLTTVLRRSGPVPASAALPLVGTVASILDELWNRERGDGVPVNLLHRNVCPDSIEVDPDGNVRLCDFSQARARVEGIEGETGWLSVGARGYVPPERIEGQEDHRGDVYSLGVVLEELVTGAPPGDADADAPTVQVATRVPGPVLALAARMRALDPRDRPSSGDVVLACQQLAESLWGPSLAEWAREHVKPDVPNGDVLDDAVLKEGLDAPLQTRAAPAPVPVVIEEPEEVVPAAAGAARSTWMLAVVAAAAAALGFVAVLVLALLGFGAFLAWTTPAPTAGPDPGEVSAVPTPDPVVVAAPVEAPAPVAAVDTDAVDPAGKEPEPEVTPEPAPDPEPVVAPEAAPAPAPVAPPPVTPAPVRPTPTPRPPSPAPVQVAPEPAPAPVAQGSVSVEGADRVVLEGAAGTFGPGSVPAGEYRVVATFAGDTVPAGKVTVPAGGAVRLRCDAAFLRCRAVR